MAIFFATWILLAIVVLVTQMRFYDAHQRTHHEWEPRSNQWVLARSGEDYRAMLRATFHADSDSSVERLRRQYVTMLAITVAYLFIGFPVAVLLLS
jgi:hypothetical protein